MLEKETESKFSLTLGKFYRIAEKVGKFTFSKHLAEKVWQMNSSQLNRLLIVVRTKLNGFSLANYR